MTAKKKPAKNKPSKALTPEIIQDDNEIAKLANPEGPGHSKGISIDAILELRDKGLSSPAIGKLLGCTPANIRARLKKYDISMKGIAEYRKNRPERYTKLHRDLMEEISPERISDMDTRDIIRAVKTVQEAERLERGESTANIAHAQVPVEDVESIKDYLKDWTRKQIEGSQDEG